MIRKHIAFEDLIFELLQKLGYKDLEKEVYIQTANYDRLLEIDIVFTDEHYNKTFVEIKKYRVLSLPSIKTIDLAINYLQEKIQRGKAQKGILIASCPINIKDHGIDSKITIWDLKTILDKAEKFPIIYNKIITLLELELPILSLPKEEIQTEILNANSLINKIKLIQPGRKEAYIFEQWCIETLKYLFEENLYGWHEQCATVDGLQRRDLVCRIIKTDIEIWNFISKSLHSKYITFEFKNYTSKISQREIFTTERYLYPKAFRSCAVIISRVGCDESAIRVIEGAMRDQGKLILSLTSQELCDMLTFKENGDDLNVYLFNMLDEFLMKLGR